jgi:multiple sugar transport system permease protein
MLNLLGSKKNQQKTAHGFSYGFLCLMGITTVFPFVWMIFTALKSPDADVTNLTSLWPEVSHQLSISDVTDWDEFATRLDEPEAGTASFRLRQDFSPSTIRTVSRVADSGGDAPYGDKKELIVGVNSALNNVKLWEDHAIAEKHLSEEQLQDVRSLQKLERTKQRKINRTILDSSFSGALREAHRFHWENFLTVMTETSLLRAFLNSAIVAIVVTVGQVFTSSLAAYAFARLSFPGRDKLFMGYLATMMIPPAVVIIPKFILMRQFGWVDTLWALTLPSMFTAYGTFLLRQFFMSLPEALEEAAILDGCSSFGIYWHVIMPLAKPALTALGIITFMNIWRQFMWPLIVVHSPEKYTMPVALASFQDMYGVQWTLLMAGSIIMIIPMLVVFLGGQRFFVKGIQIGAVKG